MCVCVRRKQKRREKKRNMATSCKKSCFLTFLFRCPSERKKNPTQHCLLLEQRGTGNRFSLQECGCRAVTKENKKKNNNNNRSSCNHINEQRLEIVTIDENKWETYGKCQVATI